MPVEFDAEIAINEVTLQADSDISTPGVGDTSYLSLTEKPQINGVTLVGNKSTEELNIDHVLVADNLSAHSGTTDTTPYTLRSAPSYAGSVAELRKIVGGTLGWNQMCAVPSSDSSTTSKGAIITDNRDGSYTINSNSATTGTAYIYLVRDTTSVKDVAPNHVYYMNSNSTDMSKARAQFILYGNTALVHTENNGVIIKTPSSLSAYTGFAYVEQLVNGQTFSNVKCKPVLFDLTAMFGSTIADAILAMETATAGSGVAFFRSLFPSDYYPYSASTLQSVQTSARQALDGNGNVIRSYPLDPDLTLRGIPKLTNGVLSYDGDEYLPSGQVTRKYIEVDLGSLTWGGTSPYYYAMTRTNQPIENIKTGTANDVANAICAKYPVAARNGLPEKCFSIHSSDTGYITVNDSSYADYTEFKTAMSGVMLVVEVTTPTTETADPYTEVQLAGETEQFVTENYIPVGNETFYPEDLTGVVQNLAPLPTTAGTYKLQVTVSGGVPSYSWVAG